MTVGDKSGEFVIVTEVQDTKDFHRRLRLIRRVSGNVAVMICIIL
jgi:nitrate reductase NapAB chaperone NapD